jgi:hypothetical protein
VRQLRDAAAGGVQAVILLRVRRFHCGNGVCPAVTFAEQVEGLTSPYSRFTPLLRGLLTQIGLALAGRAGVRFAAAAGVAVGRDTLLRLVKALPEPLAGPVPVLRLPGRAAPSPGQPDPPAVVQSPAEKKIVTRMAPPTRRSRNYKPRGRPWQ